MEEPNTKNLTITIHNVDDFISDIANEVVRKMELQNQEQVAPDDADKLLTIDEAAIFVKLKKPTMYTLVSKGLIPYSKPPHTKRLWFSRLKLIEWMKSGRRKTKAEIEDEANTYLRIRKKK